MPAANANAGSGGCDHSNYYVGASGVTDDTQKRQLLLHCAGESVQDIFFTLADTGNTYESAKAKITAYFTPVKTHPTTGTCLGKLVKMTKRAWLST